MAGVADEPHTLWQPTCLKTLYRGFGDLKVLNESEMPVTVIDYTPGESKMLWANEAWLHINSMTIQELRQIDLNHGNSEAAMKLHNTIYERVQVKKGTFSTTKTVYPKVDAES
eukprot:2759569-Rhodomonas_salina.1